MKRVLVAFAVLAIASTLALSGHAAAMTWYYYPANSSVGGPYTHVYGLVPWTTVFAVNSTTGGGTTHVGAYWFAPLGGVGDAVVDTWIYSSYVYFAPSVSDYYTINFDWYLTGYAVLENYGIPGPYQVQTMVKIGLVSYLQDTTRGVTNWCQNRTIVDASNGNQNWIMNFPYSNSYYPVHCQIALLAGDHYEGHTYISTYDEAVGAGVTIATVDSVVSLTLSQPRMTVYRYTPPPGCIMAGTSVLLADNTSKPVDNVRRGDRVMAYDPSTNTVTSAKVLGTSSTTVDQMLSINGGLLKVTPTNQPLYVRNGTWKGWLRDPQDLATGEQLFMPATGTWVNITIIQGLQGNFKVYDLQVSAPNDFVANGFLVYDKPHK